MIAQAHRQFLHSVPGASLRPHVTVMKPRAHWTPSVTPPPPTIFRLLRLIPGRPRTRHLGDRTAKQSMTRRDAPGRWHGASDSAQRLSALRVWSFECGRRATRAAAFRGAGQGRGETVVSRFVLVSQLERKKADGRGQTRMSRLHAVPTPAVPGGPE